MKSTDQKPGSSVPIKLCLDWRDGSEWSRRIKPFIDGAEVIELEILFPTVKDMTFANDPDAKKGFVNRVMDELRPNATSAYDVELSATREDTFTVTLRKRHRKPVAIAVKGANEPKPESRTKGLPVPKKGRSDLS